MTNRILIGLISLLTIINIVVLYLYINSSKKNLSPSSRTNSIKFDQKEFTSKKDISQWPVYTNKNLSYTLQYPPEYLIKETGKGGDIEDSVTFSYNDGVTVITPLQIQIVNNKPKDSKMVVEKITDKRNNQIKYYYLPYQTTKTLVVIAIAYPFGEKTFKFEEVADKMVSSIKIPSTQ